MIDFLLQHRIPSIKPFILLLLAPIVFSTAACVVNMSIADMPAAAKMGAYLELTFTGMIR